MLACRARVSLSLPIAAVFLPTFIASIWTVSAESKVHDDSTVCTSDARNFAEMHSIAPDMALLQKKAVPSQAPALLEESATTASAMPKYKNVPLSEQGYSFVSHLKDDREMQGFVRRVLDSLGLEIVDEGGLMGMVPYYSGKKAKQSFAALEAELAKEMKKRNAWALPKGTKVNEKRHTELLAIKDFVADREEQEEDSSYNEGTGNSNTREAVSYELGDNEEYDEEMSNEEGQWEEDEEDVEEDELEEPYSDPAAVETKKQQFKPRSPSKLARKNARRA